MINKIFKRTRKNRISKLIKIYEYLHGYYLCFNYNYIIIIIIITIINNKNDNKNNDYKTIIIIKTIIFYVTLLLLFFFSIVVRCKSKNYYFTEF